MKVKLADKAYLSKELFLVLFGKLVAAGFVALSPEEIMVFVKNNPQLKPFMKKVKGVEKGFRYTIGCFHVTVWTTWSDASNGPREHDQGWVVINDMRSKFSVPLYSFPMKRTKNFLETIYRRALTFRAFANEWMVCPVCKEKLSVVITEDKILMRSLQCESGKLHKKGTKPNVCVTDMPLPEPYKTDFVGQYARYYAQRARDAAKQIYRTPQILINFVARHELEPIINSPYEDLSKRKMRGEYSDLDNEKRFGNAYND